MEWAVFAVQWLHILLGILRGTVFGQIHDTDTLIGSMILMRFGL